MHLRKNFVITTVIALIAFFAGWLLSPSKERVVRSAEAAKPELRSIDCSKMIIVNKGRGETLTITQPNWIFLKIPDPLGGQSVNEECLKQQVQKYLNAHREEFFGSSRNPLWVVDANVIPHGSLPKPWYNEREGYAFVNVKFDVDES